MLFCTFISVLVSTSSLDIKQKKNVLCIYSKHGEVRFFVVVLSLKPQPDDQLILKVNWLKIIVDDISRKLTISTSYKEFCGYYVKLALKRSCGCDNLVLFPCTIQFWRGLLLYINTNFVVQKGFFLRISFLFSCVKFSGILFLGAIYHFSWYLEEIFSSLLSYLINGSNDAYFFETIMLYYYLMRRCI